MVRPSSPQVPCEEREQRGVTIYTVVYVNYSSNTPSLLHSPTMQWREGSTQIRTTIPNQSGGEVKNILSNFKKYEKS
jgi:hypothetical protein